MTDAGHVEYYPAAIGSIILDPDPRGPASSSPPLKLVAVISEICWQDGKHTV